MAVEARPLAQAPAATFVPARATKIFKDIPVVPGVVLVLLVFTALVANIIAPHDPTLPIAGPGQVSSHHRSGWKGAT
jgi:hypothetical protein